jgi:hypothetical protein
VRSQKQRAPRVDFSALLENNYLQPGQMLYFDQEPCQTALIKPDALLRTPDGFEGSIHKVGGYYSEGAPCNGWDHWYVVEGEQFVNLDTLRQRFLVENGLG